MLNTQLDRKSIILKLCLCLIILLIFSVCCNKIYNKYQEIINITAEDLSNWVNQNSGNNILIKLEKIKLNWHSTNLYFRLDNVSLSLKNNNIVKVKLQEVTGKVNILSVVLYSKIKITDIIAKEVHFVANNIYHKEFITQLVGTVEIDAKFTKDIKMLYLNASLSDPINNIINFNIDTVINIISKTKNIFVTKFKLQNNVKDVRYIIQYLPDYLVHPALLKWLDQALLSGTIDSNDLLWSKDNDFNWKIKFKDVKLHYASDWPVIEHLSATMEINNNNVLKIYMDSGDNKGFILEQPIRQLTATLNNITADEVEPLLIKAEIIAPVAKGVEFLQQSDLQFLGNYLSKLSPRGSMDLSLQLLIPITTDINEKIKFSGNCKLIKANLRIPNLNLELENLSENIKFSNSHATIENFKINMLDSFVYAKFNWEQDYLVIGSPNFFRAKILLNIQKNKIINDDFDLTIEELFLFGKDVGKIRLFKHQLTDSLYFEGANANGTLLLNDFKSGEYSMDFNELRITVDNNADDNNYNIFSKAHKIKKINFNCKNFYLNNVNLGEINSIFTKEQGLQIIGEVASKDFSNAFKKYNINSKLVQNGVGVINFNLQWPNYLHSISLNNVVGTLNLDIKNGIITGIEPGLGRVIGLLSVENIQRRLQLDFSDVTNAGFSFDQLSGTLNVNSGIIKVEHVIIKGPSAKITISGSMNLSSKQLNLFTEVTSKISATLPLAIAIAAGNPVVGAAIWLFDHVSGAKVSEFKVQKYKIVGTWDKPEIIKL